MSGQHRAVRVVHHADVPSALLGVQATAGLDRQLEVMGIMHVML